MKIEAGQVAVVTARQVGSAPVEVAEDAVRGIEADLAQVISYQGAFYADVTTMIKVRTWPISDHDATLITPAPTARPHPDQHQHP